MTETSSLVTPGADTLLTPEPTDSDGRERTQWT
jgi:hypothetical protein